MLALYHTETAVCAQKVRVALAEKNLAYESRLLDFGAGDQYDPAYMKLNPNAVVPTLIHDGKVIRESTIVCEYLDECFPELPLRPADPHGRAMMHLWTKQEDSIHEAVHDVTFAIGGRAQWLKLSPAEREERMAAVPLVARRNMNRELYENGVESPNVERALRRFERLFTEMEAALIATSWLVGTEYGLADIGLTSYMRRLEVLNLTGLWRPKFPHVDQWFAAIKARPSYKTAIGDLEPAPSIEAYHAAGVAVWPDVARLLARIEADRATADIRPAAGLQCELPMAS